MDGYALLRIVCSRLWVRKSVSINVNSTKKCVGQIQSTITNYQFAAKVFFCYNIFFCARVSACASVCISVYVYVCMFKDSGKCEWKRLLELVSCHGVRAVCSERRYSITSTPVFTSIMLSILKEWKAKFTWAKFELKMYSFITIMSPKYMFSWKQMRHISRNWCGRFCSPKMERHILQK